MDLKQLYWRWRLRNERLPEVFDAGWYREHYRDVAQAGINPAIHYLRFGRAEQRDPRPDFSVSGYRFAHDLPTDVDPVQHYETQGREAGLSTLPELEGKQSFRANQPTLMVCGHQAGKQLYGGERSLLDMLVGLNALGVNLLVTLPEAHNFGYVEQIRSLSWRLAILPYGWWRKGRKPVAATVGHFERLVRKYSVDAVYTNTLVLDEPLRAAKSLGLPTAVHVRELPEHDAALCEILGASPTEIAERVPGSADVLVANSAYTADSLSLKDALVVPNCIKVEEFTDITGPHERGEPLTVGMISSNLPKKGLDDFVALAQSMANFEPQLRFRLIGPDNGHIQLLKDHQRQGDLPANIEFPGYFGTAQEALAQLDIVVNLSHFQESFGRSILEAMAAGRPVVAYSWGALPELVLDGKNGYLVPLGDVEAVSTKIALMVNNSALRDKMGTFGGELARKQFSFSAYRDALALVLANLLKR